jgi:hypothetical protein
LVNEDKDGGIILSHIAPLNGPTENRMRPLTSLASESARVERHADIAQCCMIVPVSSMVVSPVTTIRKGADLIKRADRGAESGALCHIAGAAVKVAHCHFVQSLTLHTVVNRREAGPGTGLPAIWNRAALFVSPLRAGSRELLLSRVGRADAVRAGRVRVHGGVVRV